jgi:oxygen-dependent protoporphyrinogen oxidase
MTQIIIVGGGISGLSTAFNLQQKVKEKGLTAEIKLIEANKTLGGKAQTFKQDGYLVEVGPNGFLDNKPSTLQLVYALGINNQLQPSNDAAKKRFIYSNGKLKQLPESPASFLASDLLSIRGRIRVAMEIFTKPKPEGIEESVADFARRHMGQEAVDKLIHPMVCGVFGGDAEKLSMQSCFPLLLEIEKQGGGSLILGMIKRMREAKKAGVKMKATAGPGGRLTSFKGGMQTLVDALARRLEGNVLKGKKVERIEKTGKRYYVYLDRKTLEADVVVTATPAYTTAQIIGDLDPEIAEELRKIPYAPIAVAAIAYDRGDLKHPLDGFGFLVAKNEKRRIMGSLWTSSIFSGRAPEGKFLFRNMLGGAMQPEMALLSKEEIIEVAQEELKDILGIDAEPVFTKVFKHEKGIPQYLIGHAKRLERIEVRLKKYPGLFMTGNAFRGIGINHCTEDAIHTAEKVIEYLS